MPNRTWKHLKAMKTFLQARENNQEAVIKLTSKLKRTQEKRRQKTRPNIKNVLTFSDKKNVGPTEFKRNCMVWKLDAIKKPKQVIVCKVKTYLKTKPSFKKYHPIYLQLPRIKVIIRDISEIWSVDLAYKDKQANYNRNVKCLLVAVDCLSRYLRAEPLKTKYAMETVLAFKKMIKNKQPQKVWVEYGTEFLEAFKTFCDKRGVHIYSTFSEKNLHSQSGSFVKTGSI